jgi:hypothetical protein
MSALVYSYATNRAPVAGKVLIEFHQVSRVVLTAFASWHLAHLEKEH